MVLVAATTAYAGWEAARHYVSEMVNYTEPLFVVVIMALASTRPVIGFAESALRRVAAAGGATPAAWWAVILTIGPVLGSLITEPAAMTICGAVARRRQRIWILRPPAMISSRSDPQFAQNARWGTFQRFSAAPRSRKLRNSASESKRTVMPRSPFEIEMEN